ncbi:MAG: GH3 auxin-responsive promoter family protein [Bacteroidia bacterium]|nr:GH3 auxin-responsive promoter family protein [Bacteroidia bacterium]
MKLLNQILNTGKRLTETLSLNKDKAFAVQKRTLRKLIIKAENTEFGKQFGFTSIIESRNTYKNFKKNVPVTDYAFMHPYWQKAYDGVEDVSWPGKIEYFALSSGTSEGSSKYIPVSGDMLKSITRASIRQMISIAKTDVPKDYLAKNYLMISGSTSLYSNGKSYAGDLSGITTRHVPSWFERFSKPSMEIRSLKDWQNKIDKITEEAREWDVVMIAGVPAWIQLLFENIIERYNLTSIHDIWPHFSVYIHGGVSIDPYKKSLNKLFSKPVKYFETYLASEGFVSYQAREFAEGMRLNFRNGMFYEFVPFDEENFDHQGNMMEGAKVLPINEVSLDTDYAILLTTCSGAWRYQIGDTIRFTDLDNCEIKITGRTKHFLSMCGEHLSVENMNKAIVQLSEEFNTSFNEFTVKGLRHENSFAHHWYIACDNPSLDPDKVKERLDYYLCASNDDYITERKHALKHLFVDLVPSSVFIDWMEVQGRYGSQNKFPRVLSDEKYAEWTSFLQPVKATS